MEGWHGDMQGHGRVALGPCGDMGAWVMALGACGDTAGWPWEHAEMQGVALGARGDTGGGPGVHRDDVERPYWYVGAGGTRGCRGGDTGQLYPPAAGGDRAPCRPQGCAPTGTRGTPASLWTTPGRPCSKLTSGWASPRWAGGRKGASSLSRGGGGWGWGGDPGVWERPGDPPLLCVFPR